MKLRQIVCDRTDLTLTKERETKVYGEVFTIDDEARAKEILAATYQGKPVVEIVEEPVTKSIEDKPVKKAIKKKEDK